MLSILPALILLVLKGPAHVERLAIEGRLPTALAALQGRIEKVQPAQSVRSAESLLASIKAIGSSTDFRSRTVARAFVQLLHLASIPQDSDLPEPPHVLVRLSASPNEFAVRTQNGFALLQRSRDGPAA